MDTNNEIFDTELYAIADELEVALKEGQATGRTVSREAAIS